MKTWKLRAIQVMMLGNLNKQCSFHTYIVHRRGGKSFGGTLWFAYEIAKLLQEKEIRKLRADVDSSNPNLSYLAPTKRQARDIIWDYARMHFSRFPGAKFNDAQLTCTIPRPLTGDKIKFSLYASKFHDRMRGTAQRKIFVDELQDAPVEALNRSVLPTMDDMGKGNATLFASGTVKGRDHLHDWCQKQIELGNVLKLGPVDMTGVFGPKEIAELRDKYDEDVFLREYMCDFDAPLEGTYFNKSLTQLQKDPDFFTSTYDPNLPLCAGFDIGVGEGLAIWLGQAVNEHRINLIEYYQGYEDLKVARRDMEEDDLVPDCLFLPHDANTKQLSAGYVVKNKDVVKAAFPDSYIYNPIKRPTKTEIAIQHISNHLHLLKFPPKTAVTDCHTGLRHLMAYGRARDKMTGHFKDVVDKSRGVDHTADALRTLMDGLKVKGNVVRRFPTYRRNKRPMTPNLVIPSNPLLQSNGSLINDWREGYGATGRHFDIGGSWG